MEERASERVEEIPAERKLEPLPADVARAVHAIVELAVVHGARGLPASYGQWNMDTVG